MERARGTTWDAIGKAAGGITKQSAQKWAHNAAILTYLDDGFGPDLLRSLKAPSGAALAEELDAWYARHCEPGDHPEPEQAAHAVSGYLLDPGPAPDPPDYDIETQEWFLSDHPWARAVRIRRQLRDTAAESGRRAEVRDWTDRIDGLDLNQHYPNDPAIAESLRELAALMRPIVDHLQSHIEAAAQDDVTVAQLRRQWETSRRAAGEDGYVFPAHLIGPGAAAYPPPSGFPTTEPTTHKP